MAEKTITKIETKKSFDTEKNRWVVTYKEFYQHNNGKERWVSVSSNSHFCDTEADADVKVIEVEKDKSEKEAIIGLK